MKEILEFLRSPRSFETQEFNIWRFIQLFLIATLFVMITSAIVEFFNKTYFSDLIVNKTLKYRFLDADQSKYWFICVIVFLSPLLEELIFRLALTVNRSSLAIALGTGVFFYLSGSLIEAKAVNSQILLAISFAFVVSVVFYFFISKWVAEKLSRIPFSYYFYFSCVAFAFAHGSNFNFQEKYILFLIPFYVIPQLISGFFFGYVRLKMGFLAAVAFHILGNAPIGIGILLMN